MLIEHHFRILVTSPLFQSYFCFSLLQHFPFFIVALQLIACFVLLPFITLSFYLSHNPFSLHITYMPFQSFHLLFLLVLFSQIFGLVHLPEANCKMLSVHSGLYIFFLLYRSRLEVPCLHSQCTVQPPCLS